MAGTVTTDLVDIDLAEAITNWLTLGTWGAAFVATPDIALQGTNDLWGRVTANFGMGLAAVSSIDFTTGVHLFHFQKNICWPKAAIKSQGGMRLIISSDATPTLTGTNPSAGPTNSKSWYMGGSDTDFTTGWICYVIDPTSTPDLTLGTCVTTSINRAGI